MDVMASWISWASATKVALMRFPNMKQKRQRIAPFFSMYSPPTPLLSNSNPSVEILLLIQCVQARKDLKAAEQIRNILGQEIDWSYFLRKGCQNAVLPIVSRRLLGLCPELLPDLVREYLLEFSKSHVRNSLFQAAELVKVLRLLEANKIPVLPFKGPTLAALIYNDLSSRHYGDLDILVKKRDVNKAKNLLISKGFKLSDAPGWLQQLPMPTSRKKDYGLSSADGRVRLELHWRLSGTHFDLPLDLDNLWGRLEWVSFAGMKVRGLPIIDLLLYLSLHGTRHGWARLAWVVDIAELVDRNKNIDWNQLFDRARSLGNERSLILALYLAKELVGASLPIEIVRKLEADGTMKRFAGQVAESFSRDDASFSEMSHWHHYHLEMKEGWREKLRVQFHYLYRYAHLAVVPNRNDKAAIWLPETFHFIYFFVRPVRLLIGFGQRRWSTSKKWRSG
jgi:hypothetical protein